MSGRHGSMHLIGTLDRVQVIYVSSFVLDFRLHVRHFFLFCVL